MSYKLGGKKIIGITGGVGCGKSSVMELMRDRFGFAIIYADAVGHELMAPGGANYSAIVSAFGGDILSGDGRIDNGRLASIVFSDPERLSLLNSITHPNIKAEIKKRLLALESGQDAAGICLEAALLIEAGYDDLLDELWYVYAKEEARIKRLMSSRGYSEEKCRSMLKNQLSEEEYISHCDRVIDNSGSLEETEKSISEILTLKRSQNE